MKEHQKFPVEEPGQLLDFLLQHAKGRSRNNIKGLLKRGQITVDGKSCTDYARPLSPGQRVEILSYAPKGRSKAPFPILYEDHELLVIDKPAGMLSISTDKEREQTAYHIVTDYVKSANSAARVFIVHRLDRETSGVMLFAKSEEMKLALQDHWDELVTLRGYAAVVEGQPEPAEDTVTSWLKQTKTLFVYSSERKGDGKMAVTRYRTRMTNGEYSLLDIQLETGRKNQIRVHMSDLGHPVVGDKKYGAETNPLRRLALHADRLELAHPITKAPLRFETRAPASFLRLAKETKNP